LDRIDRYFTQLKVDHYLLAFLSRTKDLKGKEHSKEYAKKINEFQEHIENKAAKAFPANRQCQGLFVKGFQKQVPIILSLFRGEQIKGIIR